MTWNFGFLGAVSFIPFPTSLLAEYPEQLLSVVVFSSTNLVTGLVAGRMWQGIDGIAASDDATPLRVRASHAMLLILMTAEAEPIVQASGAASHVLLSEQP